jgi:hypothetical protein
MKIQEVENQYICDGCKKTFRGKEVKLEPAHNRMEVPMGHMMFVEPDGTITGKHCAEKGDSTMHCPHCNRLHLTGFTPFKNFQKLII